MIKYQLTEELERDLENGHLHVNNMKLTNDDKNLVIEIENKNDNGTMMRCQVVNYEIELDSDDKTVDPSINGALVKDLVISNHFNSYGDTYFVTVAMTLESDGNTFMILSNQEKDVV